MWKGAKYKLKFAAVIAGVQNDKGASDVSTG